MAKQARMKDPFASSALPRSFYHPSPSKGVDTNVAITGPERDCELKTSEVDAHFLKGGSTVIPALTHLNPFPLKRQHDVAMDFNNSNRSGDHFHETWPESEQPSATSFQADISPFTSVSAAEAENNKVSEQLITEYKSGRYSALSDRGPDKTPVQSVLQKYIERFRNSEPKSRMERAKENEANYQDFWWMHSSPSSPADGDSQAKNRHLSLASAHHLNDSQAQVRNERKLTKEAVMELDKETSKLQNKADHILTKSQLSLASSGPIVSTQGLGSSTSFSEYSLKTDSQAPYRPAFINIREHSSTSEAHQAPLKANYRQPEVSQDVSSPPGDILAKWRLRRKMDEVKTSSTRNKKSLTMQGVARNREIDMRLEEFRKKLLSQRALVTQEEIQYERQKMKLLMEEDTDKLSNIKATEPAASARNSQSQGVDPILARLKTITDTMERKPPTCLDLSDENADNMVQTNHKIGSISKKVDSCEVTNNSFQMDSNLNNACPASKQDFSIPGNLNDPTRSLNKNNTAISVKDDVLNRGEMPIIDNMTSVVLCDASKKYVALNEKSDSGEEDTCVKFKNKSNSVSSHGPNKERTHGDISSEERKVLAQKDCHSVESVKSGRLDSAKPDCERTAESADEKQIYRQYLEAEKPNVEVISKVLDTSKEDRDGNSSERSEKSVRKSRLKKKEKKGGNYVSEKKSERAKDFSKQDNDKEGPVCIASDDGSKTSECQDAFLSRISSNGKHQTSKNQHATKLHPEDTNTPSKEANGISQTSFSKNRQVPHTRPDSSQSSCQQNIQKAVIQTVADHLFDEPSVLSSVDSWAALFPQSPAPSKSLYDSDLASPSPQRGNSSPVQSTPTQFSSLAVTETEVGSSESDNEFEDDPLLALLRQQRQDYVKKLQIIESALIKLER